VSIRKTLRATQAATFAIFLPAIEHEGAPVPTGTGFFVSADGLFITARHVIEDSVRAIRTDISQTILQKEMRDPAGRPPPVVMCREAQVLFDDEITDIAVLWVDWNENKDKRDFLMGKKGFPYLNVARRTLDEAEPVYPSDIRCHLLKCTRDRASAGRRRRSAPASLRQSSRRRSMHLAQSSHQLIPFSYCSARSVTVSPTCWLPRQSREPTGR
jgi:hypothetical protein